MYLVPHTHSVGFRIAMSLLSLSPVMLSVLLKLSFFLGQFDDAVPCVYQWPRDRVHDFRSPLPGSRTYYILD